MEITFDEKVDALYIQFQRGKVKETIKFKDGLLIDIGNNNRLFGIEILDVSKRMSLDQLSHLDINLPVHLHA